MGTSATVTSLVASPGVGQVGLTAIAVPPSGMECLAYMQPASVEFWGSQSNNRTGASKLGSSASGIFIHGDLNKNETWYYWARAVDLYGNTGAFYPTSSTNGVSATTLTTDPGPNSVGTDELQDGAVTDEKIDSVNANKINADELSAIVANLGTVTAGNINGLTITGGNFQTATSGKRIQITGSDNYIRVYDSSGNLRASIGDSSNFSGAIIGASRSSSSLATVSFVNSSGTALLAAGETELTNLTTGHPALTAKHFVSASDAHAIRGTANTGGSGLVGLSSISGGYALYAETGTIGPFTGSHPGLAPKGSTAIPGDILVDVKVVARKSIDDTVTEVALSSEERQRNIIGVLSSRRPFDAAGLLNPLKQSEHDNEPSFVRKKLAEKYDLVTINGVGEGQMNVCGLGGDIEAGDFICTSSIPGKGQRQNDESGQAEDFPRRCTVARARESVTFSDPTAVKKVAVVYLCG